MCLLPWNVLFETTTTSKNESTDEHKREVNKHAWKINK